MSRTIDPSTPCPAVTSMKSFRLARDRILKRIDLKGLRLLIDGEEAEIVDGEVSLIVKPIAAGSAPGGTECP